MTAAFVYDAVRTPFGRFGKALAGVRPDDLAASTLRALVDRHPRLDPAAINDVILGDAKRARTTATSRAWQSCSRASR